jgi:hypothetical protein
MLLQKRAPLLEKAKEIGFQSNSYAFQFKGFFDGIYMVAYAPPLKKAYLKSLYEMQEAGHTKGVLFCRALAQGR